MQHEESLRNILDELENKDENFESNIQVRNMKMLQLSLTSCSNIDRETATRLLILCIRYNEKCPNLSNLAYTVSILSEIIKKSMNGQCPSDIDFAPCAMAIINVVGSINNRKQMDNLKKLCIDTLKSFPDKTIIEISMNQFATVSKLFNFNSSCPEAFYVLHHVLTVIPLNLRTEFVQREQVFWFYKLIPTTVAHLAKNFEDVVPIEVLEILTEELIKIDYSKCPEWLEILNCISEYARYPAIIKTLLEKQCDSWHRLWIVFIKLLKNQITNSSGPSPINAMLPVVESAFKMDSVNRCRAFESWRVLIDNFSSETNDQVLNKRIKLLLIPLRLNNAKVELTALAKFNTWWHMLIKFQKYMDKFADTVLIPFLHFCFGKSTQRDKGLTAPGQLSSKLKVLSVQAFIEIFGHINCTGCTTLPRLQQKLINTRLITNFWTDFDHSLQTVIQYLKNENQNITLAEQQMSCILKSHLETLCELPENNIRKDLVDYTFNDWIRLTKDNTASSCTSNIMLNVFVPAITDEKYIKLLKVKDDNNWKKKIVCSVLELTQTFLLRCQSSWDMQEIVQKLKPLVMVWMSDSKSSNECVQYFLDKVLVNGSNWFVWTLITSSILESAFEIEKHIKFQILNWPFKAQHFGICQISNTDVPYSASMWTNLYNTQPNLNCFFTEEFFLLMNKNELYCTPPYFILNASLAVTKYKFSNNKNDCEKEMELIENVLMKFKNVKDIEQILPLLIDTGLLMLNNIIEQEDNGLAVNVFSTVGCILKLLTQILETKPKEDETSAVFLLTLLSFIETAFKKKSYSKMKRLIVDDIISCHTKISFHAKVRNSTASILMLFLSQSKDEDPEFYSKIKNVIDPQKTNDSSCLDTPKNINNEFIAPEKKTHKKKEPSIVNTIVDNGEEYVVVKSHWKFNPKNLTENQKEKLKRKREDIPALYQDLSQSQDEFKLSSWKTDSQDTSTSASKTGDSDTSSVLKNIPSSEVVPKIIQNLMSETKEDSGAITRATVTMEEINKKTDISPVSKPKTPRMALKDRVFRNVRNLMEKSSLQKETDNKPSDLVVVPTSENAVPRTPNSRIMNMMNSINSASASKVITDEQPKSREQDTPQSKSRNESELSNSAPAMISSERPSRVRRKPKKFDDVQLIDLRKRRHSSLNDSQTGSQEEIASKDSSNRTKSDSQNEDKEEESTVKHDDVSIVHKESSNMITTLKKGKDSSSETTLNQGSPIESEASKIINQPSPLKVKKMNPKVTEDPTKENRSFGTEETKKVEQKTPLKSKTKDLMLNETEGTRKRRTEETKNINQKTPLKSKTKDPILTETIKPNPSIESAASVAIIGDEAPKNKDTEPVTDNVSHSQGSQDINSQTQNEFLETPKTDQTGNEKQSSLRKKKSRIEKELAIDMVEGHPFLNTTPEKRVRKKLSEIMTPKRKYIKKTDKPNNETDSNKAAIENNKPKTKKTKKKSDATITVNETQDKETTSTSTDDGAYSEDVIESSQDSTMTTISIKSTKKPPQKIPVIALEKHRLSDELATQSLLDNFVNPIQRNDESKNDSKNDSVIPCNKTAFQDKTVEVTATMETEPESSIDVILISEDLAEPITINTENTCIELNTEEIANADTQSIDLSMFITPNLETKKGDDVTISLNTQEDATKTFKEPLTDDDNVSSPFKDEVKRKQDFLNNTLEISPIKVRSPLREERTLSPETSNDYVVIKLTSPVQSNGEPFDKCDSPEIFTEDKVSPDKRNMSPPRDVVVLNNSSPSSSLSLRKNRPQVRSGGRAAQMLGLCMPDDNVKTESSEECKNVASTPAKRNLRMMYASTTDSTSETVEDGEENVNFLKFKKSLPAVNSSPSGPILKRKFVESADDATFSPASKRKRVSFHDPPVSTTIAVMKYIEPFGNRSPSSSTVKRQDRQTRCNSNMKSPKRLDSVFKLDTVLTKAVESFTETDVSINSTVDSEMISIDQTPVVKIVRISDLNDTDPICPELVDCTDPISNIASELSSPAMSSLLTKELEGKVECIGDLAKMTELEVNRLCIKVPKVEVAKKVLRNYLSQAISVVNNKANEQSEERNEHINEQMWVDASMQTDAVELTDSVMQTDTVKTTTACIQCVASVESSSCQTDESGSKSTKDAIVCLKEKADFIDTLKDVLEDSAKLHIADALPLDSISKLHINKLNSSTAKDLIGKIVEEESKFTPAALTGNRQLSFFENYLSEKYESKDLILLCSNLLRKAYDKSL